MEYALNIYTVEVLYTGSSPGNRCAIARLISEMILWSYQPQKGEAVLLLIHGVPIPVNQ
jgi:hypothetical protein